MSDKPPVDLPLASRRSTYALLIGVVMAMLAVGLAIPILFGDRAGDRVAATASHTADLDLGAIGGDGPATTATPSGPGATADAASSSTTVPAGQSTATTVAGGPTSTGGDTGGSPTTNAAPTTTTPPAELTASDVGVTPDTIKIGVLVPTSDTVGDPSAQSSAQMQYFQAFADEWNEEDAMYGRKIKLVPATYDILDQENGARAACLQLAQDDKVFAAVNSTGFGPPGALCLTREQGVPFLQGSGHPREVYAEAKGLYSSNFDNQTRNLANMVWFADQLGYLKGKKVGVLGSDWIGTQREYQEGIVDTLTSLGYDPFVYWLSGDPASSQSQVPVAVQQMQTHGVEVVFLGVDFINGNSFVSQADGQLYYPGYAAGDPWGWSTDFVTQAMPQSFEGALTITAMRTYDSRVGVPEPAKDAWCREIVERRTDFTLDRANDSNALYVGSMWACGVMERVKLGIQMAGPKLTRRAFADAQGQLGTIEVPYSGSLGTFRPDKLDGANDYRPQTWHYNCKCWRPLVADFSPGHYTR